MKEIIELIKEFEKKNNISIALTIFSDESFIIEEFWDEETLKEGKSSKEFKEFLKNTQYLKCEKGKCFSPVLKIGRANNV